MNKNKTNFATYRTFYLKKNIFSLSVENAFTLFSCPNFFRSTRSIYNSHKFSQSHSDFYLRKNKNMLSYITFKTFATVKSSPNTSPINHRSKFVAHMLNYLESPDKPLISNEESQLHIESSILEQFDELFSTNSEKYILGGINKELLNYHLGKYFEDRRNILLPYINNFIKVHNNILIDKKRVRPDKVLRANIVVSAGENFILNLCFLHFIYIYSYQNSDNDKYILLTSVSVKMGKKMRMKYLDNLRQEDLKGVTYDDRISFSEWLVQWQNNNPVDHDLFTMNDNIYSNIGCDIIQLMERSDMIMKDLPKATYSQNKLSKVYSLVVMDHKLLSPSSDKKNVILNMPTKLPMIVKPKPYTKKKLGGYLLNDSRIIESLIIEKNSYKINSVLSDCSIIYDMINKISCTPFKINVDLLNYILDNNHKHNLLLDPDVKHVYQDLIDKTKHQKSVYAAHKSKLILQETIIGIAQFFSRFNEIYFPVRLDQRGRLYCTPNFLNYQSNELSKALILFARPGVIQKTDVECITYLKGYGANCFGGVVEKKSIKAKLEWVDNNTDNIINYHNGVLLEKAKDKLLFLSFCMEYKRFLDFYNNEKALEFHNYLPIQLDATCNGFQHMALLSNEVTLFKELNLTTTSKVKDVIVNDNQPSDFYNFLLHKLLTYFKS